ncbi:MAG: DNA repair protein RecO [Candidatus Methylomirabilis oxygeniifera]|uniref:DNA repair protein RecO n=1 Tax=Methylomirabilis oxygeniifera TaxID=671143 RepID=D5MME5_METO1|nr:MAG: DNA repair protein RecO [Candidatus Methylomirabilis oxyfera]CBE70067.1 putative DNA repair protein recO (Recombination protein O) [Candidatus Methylomirabilis oxyfera]
MPLQTTEAIVIGGHNLGEADRIIPFFTRKLGKVRAVARGARRVRSRYGGTLELFTLGQLVFFESPNRTLHKINEFSVMEPFAGLKADLGRLGRGAYLVELAGASVEDEEPNEEIFLLLRDALTLLVLYDDPRLVRSFEIRLLRIVGYLLELYRCLVCRSVLEQGAASAISPTRGGLVCLKCLPRAPDHMSISPESLDFLRSALHGGLEQSLASPLSHPHTTNLQEVLKVCITHFFGKRLRSVAFMSLVE